MKIARRLRSLAVSPGRASRWLQYAGSALLVGGLGLFVYGFFAETPLSLVERPMTREAIVWSLGGVLLHGARIAGCTLQARANGVVPAPEGPDN